MLLRKGAILLLLCAAICSKAFSQRYNFINYSTDQGLLQSQVFGLVQADDGQLWMSTIGGISRFDGKTFYNYTTREGLAAAFTIHFVLDYRQRIWAITNSHLNLIAGNKVYTYPLPQTVTGARARLGVTPDNILWCLINGVLYSFRENRFVKTAIAGITEHRFLALIPGEKNSTWLMAPQRTLYRYKSGLWQRFTSLTLPDSTARIRNVFVDSTETVWIQTQNELMVQRKPGGKAEPWFSLDDKRVDFTCVIRDHWGNFWMGANTGAYKIRPDRSFIHFDHTNGLGNYGANDIISDREGNIWLGTNGDGLQKFPGGIFTVLDTAGNQAYRKVEVATTDRHGNLLFGNNGNDFCIYDGHVKKFPFKNTPVREFDIISAFADSHNTIWIGTNGGGLWKYENGIVQPAPFVKHQVYGILENEGRLILCTDEGLFAYDKGRLKKNPAFNEFIRRIITAGKDSLLVSTRYGLELLKDTVKLHFTFPEELARTTISAFAKTKDKIFIGTIGEGIFVWDKATGKFDHLTMAKGLATNIIYSLIFDNRDQLWAGTGKGVSRILSTDNFHTVSVRNYDREQGFNGSEPNANAIAIMHDNTIWFGTTKGLYCYHAEEDRANTVIPKLTLQSLKLFSKPLPPHKDDERRDYPASVTLPPSLVLPPGKNHVTFEFRAISHVYTNIRYSYFLKGLEDNFSVPDLTGFVVYPSLPPGKYVFNVKTIDEAGRQLGDMVIYPFTITPAFYQTLWFKGVLALTAIGMALLLLRIRQNSLRKKQNLVEILRAEEQSKIRKKTAQDFHDEMGNKLARIAVLSDILKSKLPLHDETQGLAKKIEENVALLYQGTKDIIWSLNPENDNLQFLLTYINNTGVDLFVDSDIEFEPMVVTEAFNQYYLPMDHARNIIMICKEVFTNICKHAQCTKVTTEAVLIEKDRLQLTISDNGKSFNTEINYNGNGLVNIKQRIKYMGAGMQLDSEAGKGTSMKIIFKVPMVQPK